MDSNFRNYYALLKLYFFIYFLGMPPIWVALPLCLALCTPLQGEVYTALSELEELLDTESVLLKTLHQYISDQEHRIAVLKKY